MTPTVCCVFAQTAPLGVPADTLLAVLQEYVDRYVGPAWGVGCTLVAAAAPDPSEWVLYFLDDSNQANALGYHSDDDGTPRGYVFCKTAVADGSTVGEVAAHELAELLVDPDCTRAVQSPRGSIVGLEIADAVEGPTFDVRGVPVSNFTLPSWFGADSGPGPFDYLGKCTAPWEILEGGYVPIWTGSEWSQMFGSEVAEERFRQADRRLRRSHRRQQRRQTAGVNGNVARLL